MRPICIWTYKRQNFEGFCCWVWHILQIELKLKNKLTAVNILAIPFQLYSFRRVNWLRKEIESMDQTMRNSSLLKKGIHHLKADCSRLYTKRQHSGCGLVKLESAYNAAVVGLSKYI